MAKDPDSDDCEHRLLPQFLTDYDDYELFADFKSTNTTKVERHSINTVKSSFGLDSWAHDFGYGVGPRPRASHSGLTSPTETETSDDDDYITGLTQQLAHSTVQDFTLTDKNNNLGWGLSGSPQSTLSSALCVGCCSCYQGSSRGNSDCTSKAASPPEINKIDAAWDLLYAAAGELARLRTMEEAAGAGFYPNKNGGLLGPATKTTSPISVPKRTPGPGPGLRAGYQTHFSHQQQLKAAQFEQLRQQQMMMTKKQQQQARDAGMGEGKFQLGQTTQKMILNRGRTGLGKPSLSTAAWTALEQSKRRQAQQHPSSGMRAVFLQGNPTAKRERSGTGVFLPRRVGTGTGTPAVNRNKSGCSTVLLPDRVVQALNLNLNAEEVAAVDFPAQPPYTPAWLNSDTDAGGAMRYRNCLGMGQQRGNARQEAAVMNYQVSELRLPQEWSY